MCISLLELALSSTNDLSGITLVRFSPPLYENRILFISRLKFFFISFMVYKVAPYLILRFISVSLHYFKGIV